MALLKPNRYPMYGTLAGGCLKIDLAMGYLEYVSRSAPAGSSSTSYISRADRSLEAYSHPLHHNAASGRLIAVPGPSQDLDLLCGFCVQFHHKSIRYTNWSQIVPMIPILGLTYLFLWLFSIHRTNGELLGPSQVPSDKRNYNIRDNYCRLLAHQSKKFLHQLVLPFFF